MHTLFRFDLFPQSPLDSSPHGDTDEPLETWHYTDAAQPIYAPALPIPALMISGDIVEPEGGWPLVEWTPAIITGQPLMMSRERVSNETQINVPLDHPVAQLFRYGPPNGSVWASVYLLINDEPISVFVGRVRSCSFKENEATLTVLALEEVLTRLGNSRRMSRQDSFAPYSRESGITPGGGTIKHHGVATVAGISADGLTLELDARPSMEFADHAADAFTGGFVVIEPLNYAEASSSTALVLAFGGQKRSIVEHNDTELVLATPAYGVKPGDRVIVYRGYNGSFESCKNDFDNVKRFGGFPYIPFKDPFRDGATP